MQPNKAIVGANAFAHEAGIHQDGMLKERTTYEIMNPTDVGWEGTRLVLGKHSGRAGFRNTLQEIGIRLDEEQLNEAYQRFLALADRKKTRHRRRPGGAGQRSARSGGRSACNSSAGTRASAPADRRPAAWSSAAMEPRSAATARATARSTRSSRRSTRRSAIPCELEEYHVEAVTPGEDAQGQVRLRIRAGDQVYTGHGLATDVIEASARAYLAALSKVIQGDPTAMIAGPVSAVSRWT